MAQTMMWLSNSVLCNTLGTAVILRVHGAWSRFLSSPLQSAHTVPVSPTSRQHPQQQQRNDPLCFTERRTSFREGPPPHNQASLFIYGGLEFLTSPPSAFGGGRGESGHRWRLFTSSRSMILGDQKEHSLWRNVSTFLYIWGMKLEWRSQEASGHSLLWRLGFKHAHPPD